MMERTCWGIVALWALSGCVATVEPLPTRGIVVAGPPPPPRMEEARPVPQSATAVWVSGYWHWNGASYTWIPGHWESAAPGARWYAPRYQRGVDGRYYYQPGAFRAQVQVQVR